MDWVSRRYDADKCDYVATLGGPKKIKETLPKYYFGNGLKMQFEDIMVNSMSEPKLFLIWAYGEDYMTPPPLDKRNQHNVKIVSNN